MYKRSLKKLCNTPESARNPLPNKLFFISIRVNWVEAQYAYDFPNLSLKLCLMACLISKLISWSDIAFDTNTAMVSLIFEIL